MVSHFRRFQDRINDPALITNLPSGLYEIEKQYDDGATQQTVIYKENN